MYPENLGLNKVFSASYLGGEIEIFTSDEKGLFMVRPKGFINPSLIKKDLKYAHEFGMQQGKPWTYVVDTTGNPIPNPINLFYLRRIKQLPYINKYIILTHSGFIERMARATAWIIKPDQITNSLDQIRI